MPPVRDLPIPLPCFFFIVHQQSNSKAPAERFRDGISFYQNLTRKGIF